MRSISPRWVSENDWARAGSEPIASTAATMAIRSVRSKRCIENLPSVAAGSRRRLIGYYVVGPDPTGRTGRKPGFGPRREVPRGLEIAARERRLGRREIGFGGSAVFHQRLSLELEKIRIARLGLDQSLDLDERGAQAGMPIGDDGAGVAGGETGIARRVAPLHRVGPLDETRQLGPHHVVAQLQVGGVLLVPIGAGLRQALEGG